jgi:hypothetical protein
LSSTFKSLIHFELFLCILFDTDSLLLFYMSLQAFPASFVEKTSLSSLCFWHHCQRSVDQLCIDFSLGLFSTLFLLLCLHVFMPLSRYFDYYRVILCFKIRKYDASTFDLFSQDCFGYLQSLVVPYEFRLSF